jgi:hypothetical protein
MPVIPSVTERVFFATNQAPGPMIDYVGAHAFRAVCVAFKVGLLDALVERTATLRELAASLQVDERGLSILLGCLESLGYAEESGGAYAASRMTRSWLPILRDGIPSYEFNLLNGWPKLEQVLREGRPTEDPIARIVEGEPDGWEGFERSQLANAKLSVDELLTRVRIPRGATRLLDVGGGHGLNSIAYCRKYPKLRARVFDLPQALGLARKLVEKYEVSDRVELVGGSFWTDDMGQGYDVALLFNVVHLMPEPKLRELLAIVRKSLAPGGMLVVLDQISSRKGGPTSRAFIALQSLDLYLNLGGEAYDAARLRELMHGTGYEKVKALDLYTLPGFAVMTSKRA